MPPLLDDFNLTVEPGQRIALVGASGSGKTTLLRLINGEYAPWQGDILLDDIPRSQLSSTIMSQSFAAVDQVVMLFEGTVRDNLTLWDDTQTDENLDVACQDAGILADVKKRAGGYMARVAEGGSNFSGGQCQRLEIARALVNDPAILVLDEATAALDSETERFVLDRLRVRGCTCIIVSHRLSAIRDCDQIIVLDKGRVVQSGRHEELWAQEGLYADLLKSEDSFSHGLSDV